MGEVEEKLVLNFIDESEEFNESNESIDENHNPQIIKRKGPNRKKSKESLCKTKSIQQEEVSIKVEDECTTVPDLETNTIQSTDDCQDIVVKYEPIEDISEEIKCESPSEHENTDKRKRIVKACKTAANGNVKKKANLEGQTCITDFFKSQVVNVDSTQTQESPKKNVFPCSKCLYMGNSKSNLERHMLLHLAPDEIKWYNCSECSYKTKYEHQLKSHFLIHMNKDEIEFFSCPHCDLKCARKHNLTHHIKTIHSDRENTFQCADCDYKTFSKERLSAHMKKHSKEVFSCHLCKFITKLEKYLKTHIKLVHTETDKPFLCDTCSYKSKTKRELDRHHARMHNKEKLNVFQCNNCEFNSIYKKNLEYHLLHMHNNSEGYSKFICGHCDRNFTYKNGLKAHIIRCHIKLPDEDWHKCLECKYKSKDLNTLKRHIKRNHGAPKLHCELCSFATNRQISMDAHNKTHKNKGSIYKCPQCPHRSLQTTSFLYHMRVVHKTQVSTKQAAAKYYRHS